MTETETIFARLAQLEAEVARLKAGKSLADQAIEFERLPETAVVGKEYIAYRFGCSVDDVSKKRKGTHLIKLVASRPVKAVKRDVDAAFREWNKSPKERAAEARNKAPLRRRSGFKKRAANL